MAEPSQALLGRGRPPLARIARIAALGVVGAAAIYGVASQLGSQIPRFAAWVEGLGLWAPLVFVVGYAGLTLAFVSGGALTAASGFIFGLGEGVLYSFVAAVIGSTGAFLVARHGGRRWIEPRVEGDARFAAIDRAVGTQGLKITFLLRLSPVFPFVLLNYALGLTRVRLRDYALASFGMLPGTLLYVYLGKAAGDLATALSGGSERGPGYYAVLGLGLVATGVVTAVVTRIARRALAEATGA
jgi:uncharacterized membrane protein YdjX (TVP38/TMEM64 family)